MKEYRCKNCGFEGPCYGIPTSEGVTAPICRRCKRNHMLEELN